MGRFILAARVRSDLSGIWRYSVLNYGTDQAERYIRDIWCAFERAAENPRRGRRCDEAAPGHFKMVAGSHIVIYRVIGDEVVDIVRILHQAMDIRRHL
jgi:toxin ParE1/3/4